MCAKPLNGLTVCVPVFCLNIFSDIDYIGVYERTQAGRVHFHFVVACSENIRVGVKHNKRMNVDVPTVFNFEEAKNGNDRSAPDSLRRLWSLLLEKLEIYGFGKQHHLVPVRSDKAISHF